LSEKKSRWVFKLIAPRDGEIPEVKAQKGKGGGGYSKKMCWHGSQRKSFGQKFKIPLSWNERNGTRGKLKKGPKDATSELSLCPIARTNGGRGSRTKGRREGTHLRLGEGIHVRGRNKGLRSAKHWARAEKAGGGKPEGKNGGRIVGEFRSNHCQSLLGRGEAKEATKRGKKTGKRGPKEEKESAVGRIWERSGGKKKGEAGGRNKIKKGEEKLPRKSGQSVGGATGSK